MTKYKLLITDTDTLHEHETCEHESRTRSSSGLPSAVFGPNPLRPLSFHLLSRSEKRSCQEEILGISESGFSTSVWSRLGTTEGTSLSWT